MDEENRLVFLVQIRYAGSAMAQVYSDRAKDDKTTRSDARRKMQKKQMEILDEDGKLKRIERSLSAKRQELSGVKVKAEKLQVELMTLDRRRTSLEGEQSALEHELATGKAKVRRLEHEAEQLREQAYRRDKDFGA